MDGKRKRKVVQREVPFVRLVDSDLNVRRISLGQERAHNFRRGERHVLETAYSRESLPQENEYPCFGHFAVRVTL